MYKTRAMTSRGNTTKGVPLAECLAKTTDDDFKVYIPSSRSDELMKGVLTSCEALCHTPEAAKFARRSCFVLVDHFGLNSFFDNLFMY